MFSEMFSEDVDASSENYFDDTKVSKNDLSRLIIKECCQNMRKTLGDSSKKRDCVILHCCFAILLS